MFLERLIVILKLEIDLYESLLKGNYMKLRSIALAGLLGTGLIMTSGCGTDDVVDAINNLVKPNVVYVVNAYTSDITAHADGDFSVLTSKQMKPFALAGNGDTDVYYEVGLNSSEHSSLAYGNAHLYVATPACNTVNALGKITDVSTGTGIVELVNATSSALTANATNKVIVHVTNNGVTKHYELSLQVGQTVAACGKATSTVKISDLGIVQGSIVMVTINNTGSTPYTVEDNVPATVDIDIVYLGGEDAVVVPLVKWDDLI